MPSRFVRMAVHALGLLAASPALACMVCIEMPRESLADDFASAQVVALMGPAPADPFRYAPVKVLKGQGASTPPVPLLLDRQTAAQLAADASLAVLGTWSATEGWKRRAIVTPEAVTVLLSLQAADVSTPEARLAAFGPLQGHPDDVLDQMAQIELATLPYGVLRQLTPRMDRQRFARQMRDLAWRDWQPSLILLMGLSDDPGDRKYLRRAAEVAFGQGASNLGAWATAMIEVDGAAALAWLETEVLSDDTRPAADTRAVALALESHAQRQDIVGERALQMLRDLGERHPELAGVLARTLLAAEDWSLAADMQALLDNGGIGDPADVFLVDHYLLAAHEAQTSQ
jgi:hypothetical protein